MPESSSSIFERMIFKHSRQEEGDVPREDNRPIESLQNAVLTCFRVGAKDEKMTLGFWVLLTEETPAGGYA